MKFDAIIIGGGLSGLVSGIRLARNGKKCVIVSTGQSALYFSSGSFDLLNYIDDKSVEKPFDVISDFVKDHPEHPYAKLGVENFKTYALKMSDIFTENKITVLGDRQTNHYRLTPMGMFKPTWLTIDGLVCSNSDKDTAWKKAAIFNIKGFLDFYPEFVADELKKIGVASTLHTIDMPELRTMRCNPSEFRITNISRFFKDKESIAYLADCIRNEKVDADIIFLPAFLGIQSDALHQLKQQVKKEIKLIPTFPLSIAGIEMQKILVAEFERLGGTFMLGDTVEKIETENNNVSKVYTKNHGDIALKGHNVILASGGFFSKGLIASRDKVFEPIMGLDVDFDSNRQDWSSVDFYEQQKYLSFGVKTDNCFHAIKDGKIINNLYAIGAVLSGFNPIKEGSGAGVSILTALYVADEILKNQEAI